MLHRRSFLKVGLALLSSMPGLGWLKSASAQGAPQFLLPPTTHAVSETSAMIYYWLQDGITGIELSLLQNETEIRRLSLSESRAMITIDDLQPATVYQYQVLVNGSEPIYQDGLWGTVQFRTQPFEWPMRFAAIGDSGFGDNITKQLAGHMAAQDVDFFIHLGDIAYRCDEYGNDLVVNFARKYFQPFQQTLTQVPHFPTLGNHDRDFPTLFEGTSFYHYVFPPLTEAETFDNKRSWYSFVMNDIRFICLNTQVFFTDPGRAEQNTWLDEQLADNSFRKTIIFFHVPFRASTDVHPDDGLAPAGDWERRFQNASQQIGLVMSGHMHLYEHLLVGGVHYLVSGGGSFSIYNAIAPLPGSQTRHALAHYTIIEVYEDRLRIEAFDINNTRIDSAEWPI